MSTEDPQKNPEPTNASGLTAKEAVEMLFHLSPPLHSQESSPARRTTDIKYTLGMGSDKRQKVERFLFVGASLLLHEYDEPWNKSVTQAISAYLPRKIDDKQLLAATRSVAGEIEKRVTRQDLTEPGSQNTVASSNKKTKPIDTYDRYQEYGMMQEVFSLEPNDNGNIIDDGLLARVLSNRVLEDLINPQTPDEALSFMLYNISGRLFDILMKYDDLRSQLEQASLIAIDNATSTSPPSAYIINYCFMLYTAVLSRSIPVNLQEYGRRAIQNIRKGLQLIGQARFTDIEKITLTNEMATAAAAATLNPLKLAIARGILKTADIQAVQEAEIWIKEFSQAAASEGSNQKTFMTSYCKSLETDLVEYTNGLSLEVQREVKQEILSQLDSY